MFVEIGTETEAGIVTTQQEELTEPLFLEALLMISRHAAEVGYDSDIDPDINAYLALQAAGKVKVYTLRKDDILIGYAVFIISHFMQDRKSLRAMADMLYVEPQFRGPRSLEFLKYCEQAIKQEGAEYLYHLSTVSKPIGPVLEHLGYEKTEELYRKKLQGD